MKKFLFVIAALVATFVTQAQTVRVTPATFTAEDRITITFDVNGFAPLEGQDLYLWAWSNVGDAPNNGSWTSSSEAQKMTRVENNVWTISFIPADFYNKPAGQMTFIGFLAKAKDGSGSPERKTGDNIFNLDPIAFNDTKVRRFPFKFTQNDVLSVFYDKNLDTNSTMKNTTDISVFTQVKTRTNGGPESDWKYTTAEWPEVGNEPKLKMITTDNVNYRWTIIPSRFFPLQPGEKITQIKVHVRSSEPPVFDGPRPPASLGDEVYQPQD